jgi:hypothetical protein
MNQLVNALKCDFSISIAVALNNEQETRNFEYE